MNSLGHFVRQALSIGREEERVVNETAERLRDLAEAHMRNGGYGGFSFRDLAAELGIKSASVHHHFPTKAMMAAAVARRYAERFFAAVARRSDEGAEDAVAAYRSTFKAALGRDRLMCLFGVLSVEAGGLPPEVATKYRSSSDDALTTYPSGSADPIRKRGPFRSLLPSKGA
jgi:AcrR family transcriptional regulator